MSQKTLADLAGLSQTYISQIEAGQRPLDRKSTQVAIATALNISIGQLLGVPTEQADPVRDRATAHVPAIRSAIVELSVDERRQPQRDPDTLRQAVDEVMDLHNGAQLAAVAPVLPDLLRDIGGHNGEMASELVDALFYAQVTLKNVGFRDLSREAASVAGHVADTYDDELLRGKAKYAFALAMPPENAALGATVATRAADDLQHVQDRDAQQVYGMLHLIGALHSATALRPADSAAHLDEADDVARSLGEPDRHGDLTAGAMGVWFGPTNVDYWRVSVAAELGDTGAAQAAATHVDLGAVPVPSRWVYHWTDLARALAAGGKDREAMLALLSAERAAPQHVRFNPIVRNLVCTLIERAKRRAVAEEFARLARTLGVDSA